MALGKEKAKITDGNSKAHETAHTAKKQKKNPGDRKGLKGGWGSTRTLPSTIPEPTRSKIQGPGVKTQANPTAPNAGQGKENKEKDEEQSDNSKADREKNGNGGISGGKRAKGSTKRHKIHEKPTNSALDVQETGVTLVLSGRGAPTKVGQNASPAILMQSSGNAIRRSGGEQKSTRQEGMEK